MIKKLKIKFISLAVTALALMMAVMITGMNLINYNFIVEEADILLSVISRNKGAFPDIKPDKHPEHLSPEAPYESRYFSVLTDHTENVIYIDTSKIVSVDAEQAKQYAVEALSSDKNSGFTDKFRFMKSVENDHVRVVFLDCGKSIDSFYHFLKSSIYMALTGLLVLSAVIILVSERIIRPIAESYDKQKRFITDAGHEIKTPLTIISANVDILESNPDDTDCISDIRHQTERLTTLTNDLVFLAKMEESTRSDKKTEMPFSEIVNEAADSFQAIIQTKEQMLERDIQPGVTINGNPVTVRKLIDILMDNGVKYTPKGGKVKITLKKQGQGVQLSLCNTTQTLISKESIARIFDRFYRIDDSRNSETGGHGIGLSVAKAIMEEHGGQIKAETLLPSEILFTCTFPRR